MGSEISEAKKSHSESQKSIQESQQDEEKSISEAGFDFSKNTSGSNKKNNFDFLDSDSESEKLSKKSNDDLLDFLSKPVTKTPNEKSADQDKLDKINDTIAKIDDTNFDFLNSTDDEKDFKPLDQKVKSNFSFLDSDQSEGEP